MHSLVVFESMFGNTESIAKAVADGLSYRMRSEVVEVGTAPRLIDSNVGLLVVGGPTHAFGMSRSGTRQTAAQQAGNRLVSKGIGLREWLADIRRESALAAAAFDTRIDKPRVPGSAGRAVEKRLRRLGLRLVAPAESFYVLGTEGPLLVGELERARRWGQQLGSDFMAEQASPLVTTPPGR
jgi:hypothetical protein